VPAAYKDPTTGYALGKWLSHQRAAYCKGKLSPERIAALEALGVTWDVLAYKFEEGLSALRRFRDEHGHANVPTIYRDPPTGFTLGVWLSHQRAAYRQGELSPERIAVLEALGVTWDVLAYKFEEGLSALRRFREQIGHANVPATYKDPSIGFALGKWVNNQRQAYRQGKLLPDRVAALETLGVAWSVLDDKFEEGLDALRRFWDGHGSVEVPKRHKDPSTGFALGTWVKNQRQAYRKGKLSPDRVAALNALSFAWNPPKGPRKTPSPSTPAKTIHWPDFSAFDPELALRLAILPSKRRVLVFEGGNRHADVMRRIGFRKSEATQLWVRPDATISKDDIVCWSVAFRLPDGRSGVRSIERPLTEIVWQSGEVRDAA